MNSALLPRYWLTWIGLFFLRISIYLPKPFFYKLGSGIGELGYWLTPKRRHITEVNIHLCFPELSLQQQSELVRKSYRSVGIGLLEMSLAFWGNERQIRQRVEFEGLDAFLAEKTKGKGVLLLTPHMTTLELLGRFLGLVISYNVFLRHQKNSVFESVSLKCRQRYVQECIFHENPKKIIRYLQQGKIVGFLPDQDYGIKNGLFAHFFGIPAATTLTPARLARIARAKIFVVACYRNMTTGRYRVVFQPAIPEGLLEDEATATLSLNQCLEQLIREAPDHYLWSHRRFKTRPAGEPSLYTDPMG